MFMDKPINSFNYGLIRIIEVVTSSTEEVYEHSRERSIDLDQVFEFISPCTEEFPKTEAERILGCSEAMFERNSQSYSHPNEIDPTLIKSSISVHLPSQ